LSQHEPHEVSEAAARQEFHRLLIEALQRHASGTQIIAELSGGMDSRHLAIAAVRSGSKLSSCVTSHKYPPNQADERGAAQYVAQSIDVPWNYIRPPRNRMAAERDAALLQGFCSDEGAWHLYRLTRRNLGKLWMNGIGGDVLTGRFVTVEHATDLHNALNRGDFTRAARLMFSSRRSLVLPVLARRWRLPLCSRREAVERVASDLDVHSKAVDPLAAFLFRNRVRRKLLPAVQVLLASEHRAITPFMDGELSRFLLGIGPRVRYSDGFHARVISEVDSAFAAQPSPSRPIIGTIVHVVAYRRELQSYLSNFGSDITSLVPSVAELAALRSPRLMIHTLTQTLQLALQQFELKIYDFRR
jgi:asparagine synthetase B (glutamine-hydrolysing)